MLDAERYSEETRRLWSAGHPGDSKTWHEGSRDYVAEFGFTPAHIPELIELAKVWTEKFEWPNDDSGYAPFHAWRVLAQLGAVEAVPELLGMLDTLNAMRDDWSFEEFPKIAACIGPPALPFLAAYLADVKHDETPRSTVAMALGKLARRHPETRDAVVRTLAEQLTRQEASQYGLNGWCVSELLDLQAVEAAEPIERALSAGVVDEGICGGWKVVSEGLGVPGLGLPQPKNPYNSVEQLRQYLREHSGRPSPDTRRKQKKNLAAKLKQRRKK